eukprot:6962623-Pyramimonas_sp.AAC.1
MRDETIASLVGRRRHLAAQGEAPRTGEGSGSEVPARASRYIHEHQQRFGRHSPSWATETEGVAAAGNGR